MDEATPASQSFRAVLTTDGPTSEATFVVIPFDAPLLFGGRGRIAVCGTINGVAYRASLFPYGGVYYMGVNAALRAAVHVTAGDAVDITMQRDDEPRTVATPPDLDVALQANPAARAAWDKLSPSHRREYVQAIEDTKKPETRKRRVEKTIDALGKKARS